VNPGSVAPEIKIGHDTIGQLAGRQSEFLGGGAADEVPAVPDVGDGPVGEQGEGERHGQRAVAIIGVFGDAKEVGDGPILVAEEHKTGPEPGLERLLYTGRVNRDDGDLLVGNVG